MITAKVVSNPCDSIIDYECDCGAVYSLEPDAGIIICDECGDELDCDVMNSLSECKIGDEWL